MLQAKWWNFQPGLEHIFGGKSRIKWVKSEILLVILQLQVNNLQRWYQLGNKRQICDFQASICSMGSSGSSLGPHKVTPQNDLRDEGAQPKPQWALPALSVTVEQPPGSLGHRRRKFPPLREEPNPSTLSGTFAVSNIHLLFWVRVIVLSRLPPKQMNNCSIIYSQLLRVAPQNISVASAPASVLICTVSCWHTAADFSLIVSDWLSSNILSPQALQPLVAQMSCTHSQNFTVIKKRQEDITTDSPYTHSYT